MVYGSQRYMGVEIAGAAARAAYFTAACVRFSPLATFTPLSVST
jgi:hypothetical protein